MYHHRKWRLFDGDKGPFTWDEFVSSCGSEARARERWVAAGREVRMDGAAGPFAWPEFVRYYGSVEEAARRWRLGSLPLAEEGRALFWRST